MGGRASVAPRKKFAFSNKTRTANNSSTAGVASTIVGGEVNSDATIAPPPGALVASARAAEFEADEYTIEDLTGQTVVVERGTFSAAGAAAVAAAEAEIASLAPAAPPVALVAALKRARAQAGGRDVRIQRCVDCVFIFLDIMRAVRADALTRCVLVTGPIAGSLLLHGATDSVIVAAARQFRLHTSKNCDFFIRARSRPIIEHCTAVRFAPYPLAPDAALAADLAAAELDYRMTSADLWRSVDDFGWLRAQKSPNWGVMTRVERTLAAARILPIEARERGLRIDDERLWEGLAADDAGPPSGSTSAAIAAAPATPAATTQVGGGDDEL